MEHPKSSSAEPWQRDRAAIDAMRALVRAILSNAHAFKWSLQGMGMLRLHLPGDYRLHVWDSRYRVPNVSMVHDHLQWGLHSTIISGELTNRRYHAVADGGVPYVFGVLKPGEGCYFKSGPEPVLLRALRPDHYGPGDAYQQQPDEIHESDPLDGTVTLMRKLPTSDESARVFWPAGGQWVSAEPRAASVEEVADITSRSLERWFGITQATGSAA